ncbi:MAG TPA: type ISP restriction/modification enzyme, partial [Methylomirabilota bacterium]|nr:type ISP restriction/modification enzyme [Methylomirabilota bacterium]
MLLPYYIASLNIEHEYYSRMGEYESFEGICFSDTLELSEEQQLPMFVEENTERVKHEKDAQIMVVIGNPPYNVGQKNENENNKNRRNKVIDGRIHETYARASNATLNNKLYDAYVKFFRWAIDRLQGRDGIVCFVSNNSFISNIAFDGMRKYLAQDFTHIYHLDLSGDARRGLGGNVFGIRVGVGITLLIRHRAGMEKPYPSASIYYHKVVDSLSKGAKLAFLMAKKDIKNIEWQELEPDDKHTWITEGLQSEFNSFLSMGNKEAKTTRVIDTATLFKMYFLGVSTNRDSKVYDFEQGRLAKRIEQFVEDYNSEVSRWVRVGRPKDIDNFVRYDRVKWSEHLKGEMKREHYTQLDSSHFRVSIYRPFCKKWLYYDPLLNDRPSSFNKIFPAAISNTENTVIVVSDHGYRTVFSALAVNAIPDLHLLAATDGFQCFPYYTFAEGGSNCRENITDWALSKFQTKYGSEVTKWDIFHYVYSMLHHPEYREHYAENLKHELPHIPLLQRQKAFEVCVGIGKQLINIHLNYEQAKEYPLKWIENQNAPFSWRVEKMHLIPDRTAVIVNESLTLSGIPQECFQYRLGNRSALDWVIDQYQVSIDKRSGIVSDPNSL